MKILHKIFKAFLRTFFFLLAKISEWTHSLCLLALEHLGDAAEDPESLQKVEGMSVSQIQEALGISRRKAHEIQKKQKEKPLPSPEKPEPRKIRPFRTERLGYATER